VPLLKCVLEEVAMPTLTRALCMALGQHAHAALTSLAANLGLVGRPYSRHSGAWDEKSVAGDGASLITDDVAMGLHRPVLAQAELGVGSD
jgi:hypothetical protein